MIIRGRQIVLAGRFSKVSKDEAKRGLEALGAEVSGSVSAKTDLVFTGAKSGAKAGPAAVRGIPIHDEDALVAVLSGPGAARPFTGVPDERMSPVEALAILENADWSAFSPERDTVPLRAALQALESAHGVTDAHLLATARLREAGALLRHSDVHRGPVNGHALSPDGRHLAVGSCAVDDHERGGVLQIFEVATGHCVHAIDGITGGVGFDGHARGLQWSADGSRIALEYNTNMTGVWEAFGTAREPIADAFFRSSGRPAGMAFAPEGRRAFVYGGRPGFLRNVIVAMHEGSVAGPPDAHPEGTAPIEFSAEKFRETWGEEPGFALVRAFWSRDGSRIYGQAQRNVAISLDVDKRQVSWVLRLDDEPDAASPEWSLDERLLAYPRGGKLVIADALTGRARVELAGHPGAGVLCWGPGGRLAVVDPAGGTVTVIDGTTGEHRHDLNVRAAARDPHDTDARSWAWSPDGERAACVTAEGRIEIWSLGERPERLRIIGNLADGFGVEWPADDVLIAIGTHAVRFLRPGTGTGTRTGTGTGTGTGAIMVEHPFHHAPSPRRPLVLAGRDLGDRLRPNPAFALDEETWAAAFEDGTVIAPPGRQDDLDDRLCWSIGRRFAWPYRWGEQRTFPDPAHAGAAAATPETERLLAPFRGRGSTAETMGTWPPPDTATVTDLITVARGTLVDLARANVYVRDGWIADTLQQLAMIHVRRGEAAEARELALAIPEHERRPGHRARIALALGAAGYDAEAAAVFPHAAHDLADVSNGANVSAGVDMAAIAGAYAILGQRERAERWFASARKFADATHDSIWTHWHIRLPLIWALTECGREQEARVVLDEGVSSPLNDGVPWLVCLLRRGETELVRELIGERSGRRDPERPFAHRESWFEDGLTARALTVYGQPDLLRLWGEINLCQVEDDLPVAERIAAEGRPTGPTAAQLTDLATRYAELAQLSHAAQRRKAADVAWEAAECGHISAVLDLLPRLSGPLKYVLGGNSRTQIALRALQTIVIGVGVDVW
ncbi:BRCT domain-containing protein [Nonomuraea sp. CA-143628]|uniref:BRCT domain-containing protein n=1 Tax=Nonomuraea sp. CA-143628 TaxID=3239997 RepID=UPI003D8C858D